MVGVEDSVKNEPSSVAGAESNGSGAFIETYVVRVGDREVVTMGRYYDPKTGSYKCLKRV